MKSLRSISLTGAVALVIGCSSSPVKAPAAQSAHSAAPPPVAADAAASSQPRQPSASAVVKGNGRLYMEPAPPTPAGSSAGGMQLSFVDTDIAVVVGTVLGDALGYQYVIDPQVKGNITLQSTGPVGKDQLFEALESALRLHDIALVPSATGYRVIPLKEAPRAAQSLRTPDSKGLPGYGIEIVPLQYAGAAEVEKVLQPISPPGSVVRIDEARNLLMIAGTSQERAALADVVRIFDTDVLAGMSYAFFRLEYVDAKAIISELNDVLGGVRGSGVTLRFIPITRLNAVLAMSPQAHQLEEVEEWIRRLDVADSAPGRRIYVYDVQHGKAGDLAGSLGKILTESSSSGEAPSDPNASGPKAAGTGGQSAAGWSSGGLRVVPSDENNSLLIMATPSEYALVEGALKKLDVPPRQVLIEASLAEVTLNDQLRFGIQWFSENGEGSARLSQTSSGALASILPGFSYIYTGSTRVDAVLNALEGITDVKVISSPKLLVLNNHEAFLQVGDQVPVVTQSAVATSDRTAPIVNSVQMRDTGVILRVTPRVNAGGLVMLEVSQEVSDVAATTTSGIDSPTIQQRRVSSTIAVHSGQTIALGGLIRENTSDSKSGLPGIQRIPLLGRLFGNTDYSKRRTELIVLLTPRIVTDQRETQELSDYLRQQFKSFESEIH